MSQQPQKYQRNYNFNTFSLSNPTSQQPGQHLDVEFDDIVLSIGQTIDRLNEIQRDDGKIKPTAIDPSGLIPGPQGATGLQGVEGPQGIQGIQGPIGPQGVQGPVGQVGPQGPQGIQGPVGQTGPTGAQGIQGPQGIQGLKGDKYKTTSSTMVAVSNGPKTFWVEQGLSYTPQQSIVIAHGFSYAVHMHGDVIAYDPANGMITVDVKGHSGGGSYNDWIINLEGAAGIQGPQGIQGIQGPAGNIGPQGPAGPTGPAGEVGPQGPAGNAWVYTGSFDYGRTYNINEMVSADGSSYVMSNYIGAAGYYPSSYPEYWQLVASRGNDGSQGPQGEQGPQGPQGEPGSGGGIGYSDVSNWLTNGNSSNQPSNHPGYGSGDGMVLGWNGYNLSWMYQSGGGGTGPQGETGPQGPQGEQGPPGPGVINWRGEWSYYQYYPTGDVVTYDGSSYVSVNGGNANTYPYEGNYYWMLLARKGDQGPQGNDGSGGGSNPSYYNSVWAYGQWYNANVTMIYDSNSGSYYNVLTF